jgi:hypothetical protein
MERFQNILDSAQNDTADADLQVPSATITNKDVKAALEQREAAAGVARADEIVRLLDVAEGQITTDRNALKELRRQEREIKARLDERNRAIEFGHGKNNYAPLVNAVGGSVPDDAIPAAYATFKAAAGKNKGKGKARK